MAVPTNPPSQKTLGLRITATLFYNANATSTPPSDAFVSQSCCADLVSTLGTILGRGLTDGECVWRELEDGVVNADAAEGGAGPTGPHVKELTFPLPPSNSLTLHTLRHNDALTRFERTWSVELVLQPDTVYRRHKRLAVFDMDSTLIQQEVIDQVAASLGLEAQVGAITAAAMNGELDFEESLRRRCALLKGVRSDVWETLKSEGRITLTPGAADLIKALKRLGFKTAVLSGGFVPMATWLADLLKLDYAYANELVVAQDDSKTLTGELTGQIVHAERKRELVRELAEREGVLMEQIVAVGDGANDLPMLGIAGLGVAFNAKARVQLEAPARLNRESLRDVLYLLGLTRSEQEELLR